MCLCAAIFGDLDLPSDLEGHIDGRDYYSALID